MFAWTVSWPPLFWNLTDLFPFVLLLANEILLTSLVHFLYCIFHFQEMPEKNLFSTPLLVQPTSSIIIMTSAKTDIVLRSFRPSVVFESPISEEEEDTRVSAESSSLEM